MDGTDLTNILQNLDTPNSVIYADDTIYILDSMYKSTVPRDGLRNVNIVNEDTTYARIYVKRYRDVWKTIELNYDPRQVRNELHVMYVEEWEEHLTLRTCHPFSCCIQYLWWQHASDIKLSGWCVCL